MKKLENLENLVKIGQIKVEPPDQDEFDALVQSAAVKLKDINLEGLSVDSQFSLAYSAAHALSLAALRWHGYRSDNRYLVFQCLIHTVNFDAIKWRVLDMCHNKRNIAEYEGHLEIDSQLLSELILISHELIRIVSSMGKIKHNM